MTLRSNESKDSGKNVRESEKKVEQRSAKKAWEAFCIKDHTRSIHEEKDSAVLLQAVILRAKGTFGGLKPCLPRELSTYGTIRTFMI